MSSPKLPTLLDPEAAAAMLAAVRAVAEQSFFAVAEPCDDRSFDELGKSVSQWLVASVQFQEGPLAGSIACTLPEDLAHALFDSFTGRDPSEPDPPDGEVHDLIGEFSNMVCGAWLTRVASRRTFTLHHPVVERITEPASPGSLRLFVAVDDLPLAVDLRLQPAAKAESAAVRA